MPGSSSEGKAEALEMILELPRLHEAWPTILDVGAGMGTWFDLLEPHLPEAHFTAVEIFEPYVERYKLRERYDTVIVGDIRELIYTHPFDLVIFGDVLEHMTKAEAVRTVAMIPWRFALISIPIVEYPQEGTDENPHEAHVATWLAREVLDAFSCSKWWAGEQIGIFMLERGR